MQMTQPAFNFAYVVAGAAWTPGGDVNWIGGLLRHCLRLRSQIPSHHDVSSLGTAGDLSIFKIYFEMYLCIF
jgi:hypothetical protein